MRFDVSPPASPAEEAAIRRALELAGAHLESRSPHRFGGWSTAARREALENEPARPSYALSPRSTRGATRA